MASKFMVDAAFKARLLLRPSHQRTVLFGTVNKLECPIPGRLMLPPILSSRSYSASASTPPLPKPSGSTKSSQSSGPEDKAYSTSTSTSPFPKSSGPTEGWFSSKILLKATACLAAGFGILGAGLTTYGSKSTWGDFLESVRESAIYDKLIEGPVFRKTNSHTIPRKALVKKLKQHITPTEDPCTYSLVIGEPGTGKTKLIELAISDMGKPKGVVYVDIPPWCRSEVHLAEAIQMGLGRSLRQAINDSSKPSSLPDIFEYFSDLAIKYKQEYGKVPVLVIDNANRLAQAQQNLLNRFQDYAEDAAHRGILTVIFASGEGCVSRRMQERSSSLRHRRIIEIGDVSKEEALEYLKLWKIEEEQAAQIYGLVGGHMLHLELIATEIKNNHTFEDMRKSMFIDAEGQLQSAKIAPHHRYHKDGAKIIRELLEKGSISRRTLVDLVGVDTGDKLLETNVFTIRYPSQEITFQSVVMKRYCEENSALWEGNE